MAGCGCIDCNDITIPQGNTGPTGPTGADGADGSNGIDGASLLKNDVSDTATSTTSQEILKSYTLPAGELSTNGDMLEVKLRFKSTGSRSNQYYKAVFDGTTDMVFSTFTFTIAFSTITLYLTRKTSSTLAFEGSYQVYNTGKSFVSDVDITPINITSLDLDNNSYVISGDGDSVVSGDVVCQSMQVIKYKKV